MMDTMPFVLELLLSVLILFGAALVLIGSIGLVKLPDFYTRLHAPTKATTLGMGSLLIASLIFTSYVEGALTVQQLLITLFLFITAPIAAHMLAKTALHLNISAHHRTANIELQDSARNRQVPNTDPK
ncbi:MAG TPA: Na+/H+ antiporter subunit G [Marinobacterium sp.]|nr:Na+/H+ antiporter subunit G [Marinobacterium sp.]